MRRGLGERDRGILGMDRKVSKYGRDREERNIWTLIGE